MADTSGEQDIRGINIDKLAKGFADEANILKRFVTNSKTKAREIRWYQKTSGFLTNTTTTGITKDFITSVGERARPQVIEQSWTRQTSYVKKFFVESPIISAEDIKDSDIDILATNVRDIVRAVARKVDLRIFTILFNCLEATPTLPLTNGSVTVQNTAATGTGWDDAAAGDPILDILNGKQLIRAQGYDPEGSILGMNSVEHKLLLQYLISTKGSSIPQFSSEKVRSGVVMELLGCNVVVSENFTTDWVYQWVPSRAATWKAFMPITSVVIDEPGIGKKFRCWEEGECLLTDPKAVHVISDTIT
jgi:hypothetical protein